MERKISGIKLERDEISETKDYMDQVSEFERVEGSYYFHRNKIKIFMMYLVFVIFLMILVGLTIIFIGEILSNEKFKNDVLGIIKQNLSGIIFAALAILGFTGLNSRI